MRHHQKSISICLLILITSNYSYGKESQSEQISKYNYRLFSDAKDLLLVNPDGFKIRINSTDKYSLLDESVIKNVVKKEFETQITLTDNTQLLFYGSYLVQHTDAKGTIERLNYTNKNLNNDLRCESLETSTTQKCTSEQKFDFTAPLISSNTTQIDIRPPNCKSYFDDYLSTRRGLQIESALEQHFQMNGYTPTPQTFPVIDFIKDRTAHITKSRDLSKESFHAKDALYEQLIQDIEEIDKMFEEDTELSAKFDNHSMTINKNQIQHSVLNIIIQNGIATENQKAQLVRILNELKGRSDISLKIIEIP